MVMRSIWMEVRSGRRAKLEVERELPLSAQQENRKAVPSTVVWISLLHQASSHIRGRLGLSQIKLSESNSHELCVPKEKENKTKTEISNLTRKERTKASNREKETRWTIWMGNFKLTWQDNWESASILKVEMTQVVYNVARQKNTHDCQTD